MPTSRRRSATVAIGTVVLAASLSACSTGSDYSRICTDSKTNQRLSDSECRSGSGYAGAHGWYYLPAGSKAPAVGQRATGGVTSVPSGKSVSGESVSAKGGTVSRGGFVGGHGSVGG